MPVGPQCADPMTADSQRAGCDSCRPEARRISPQTFRYHRDVSRRRRLRTTKCFSRIDCVEESSWDAANYESISANCRSTVCR